MPLTTIFFKMTPEQHADDETRRAIFEAGIEKVKGVITNMQIETQTNIFCSLAAVIPKDQIPVLEQLLEDENLGHVVVSGPGGNMIGANKM